MMARRLKYMCGVVALVGLLVGSLIYLGRMVFAESLYFGEVSLPYYLLLDDQIKGLPMPGQSGSREFFYSAGDGPKPPAQGVTFFSRASREDITQAMGSYLRNQGYRKVASGEYVDEQHELLVYFNQREDTLVRVRVTRYFTAEGQLDVNWK